MDFHHPSPRRVASRRPMTMLSPDLEALRNDTTAPKSLIFFFRCLMMPEFCGNAICEFSDDRTQRPPLIHHGGGRDDRTQAGGVRPKPRVYVGLRVALRRVHLRGGHAL